MLKQKNRLYSILLLGICVIFLTQGITVTHVLCYKANGDCDVELAFLGFQCQCKTDHSHEHITVMENGTTPLPTFQCVSCFDLPLNDPWLNRDLGNIVPYTKCVYQNNISNPIPFQQEEPCKRLPEAVPLSKFLSKNITPATGVILRC